MIYNFEKSFIRDFRNIKSKKLAKEILETINQVSRAETILEIEKIKRLSGYRDAYRIRSGDYRIGVIIKDGIVTFVAFAHRNEIYKRFP